MSQRDRSIVRPGFTLGFTLVEAIVVIGILALLIGILLPVISSVREQSRRATDMSNLRQLTRACLQYASEDNDAWPVGRLQSPAAKADDYTWLSYTSCWQPLVQANPAIGHINSCQSVLAGYADIDDFGVPGSPTSPGYSKGYGAAATYPNDCTVGWVYWGGRADLITNGITTYRSPLVLRPCLSPSSQTLWTCWCWDSNGNNTPSVCPHVRSTYREYPAGQRLAPPPDGLCVGLTDGSATFARWDEMIIVTQSNGYKLYYLP